MSAKGTPISAEAAPSSKLIRIGFFALISHWRRRKAQLLTLVLGLALATALWSGVQALNAEARASYAKAEQDVSAAAMPRILSDGPLTLDDFITLRRGGWLVTPIVEGRTQLAGQWLRVLGLDPLTAPDSLRPEALSPGSAAVSSERPWVAAPALAEKIGAVPSEGLPADLVVTDLAEAQALLGLGAEISRFALLDAQPMHQQPLASLGPYREVPPEPQPDLGQMTGSFHLNLTAFGLLAFAVGLFVVQGTIGLAFEERRATLRTLRALGLPIAHLAAALLLELTLLALLGGVLGVALGGVLAGLLLPDVAASLSGLYGAALPSVLALRPEWWATGLAMALGGTWLAGASALWRLAKLPLLAPARPRAWALASRRKAKAMALVGAALLALSAAIFAFSSSLFAGFAGLAAMMLGAAFLLPLLLGLALNFGQSRAHGAQARWLWADTAQQVPGLSLALAALLLALAANFGVSTMVGSFRGTFVAWLDQRLSAELYVTTESLEQSRNFAAWAAPRAASVLPIFSAEDQLDGQSVELYGIIEDPTYRQTWPILSALPSAWDDLAAAKGVLISEQLARRLDLGLGEALALPGWTTQVLGIYADYGNPFGQIILNLDQLLQHYPQTEQLRYGLRSPPDQIEALRLSLTSDFGLRPEQITDQLAQKRAAIAIFDRTFLITGALNVLTLGVAAFAMFTALLTLARMRLPQLAPVWAMGLTRQRLALLDLARTLVLALLTWILALPLGLVLAWALLARINVAAFGWRLPLSIDPASLFALLGGALLAAFAAALIPALKLAKLPPTALLKVFSIEK